MRIRWKLVLAFTIATCLMSASPVFAAPPWTDPRYLYRYFFLGNSRRVLQIRRLEAVPLPHHRDCASSLPFHGGPSGFAAPEGEVLRR